MATLPSTGAALLEVRGVVGIGDDNSDSTADDCIVCGEKTELVILKPLLMLVETSPYSPVLLPASTPATENIYSLA